MALELEHRHQGKLGLLIVPVGLTFSAKETYRSDALVHFGEPIRVAEFVEGYSERRKECITRLTHEIEARIQALILHIPALEHTRIVEAVKRLYLDHLRVGAHITHELLRSAFAMDCSFSCFIGYSAGRRRFGMRCRCRRRACSPTIMCADWASWLPGCATV